MFEVSIVLVCDFLKVIMVLCMFLFCSVIICVVRRFVFVVLVLFIVSVFIVIFFGIWMIESSEFNLLSVFDLIG